MTLSITTTKVEHERPRIANVPSFSSSAYLAELEANSQRPEVQKIIREGIKSRAIRVAPIPGTPNRVRVSSGKGTF